MCQNGNHEALTEPKLTFSIWAALTWGPAASMPCCRRVLSACKLSPCRNACNSIPHPCTACLGILQLATGDPYRGLVKEPARPIRKALHFKCDRAIVWRSDLRKLSCEARGFFQVVMAGQCRLLICQMDLLHLCFSCQSYHACCIPVSSQNVTAFGMATSMQTVLAASNCW